MHMENTLISPEVGGLMLSILFEPYAGYLSMAAMIIEMCIRTIFLKNGKIVADGSTVDILSDEKLMDECGLEIPLALKKCPVCNTSKCFCTNDKGKGI